MRNWTIALLAIALAAGCVKDNELFQPGTDAGTDADTDTDTDTDTDADTDADADTDTCADHAYLDCHDSDVYWFDSCGEPGELFDECGVDEICRSTSEMLAECCAAQAYTQCDDASGDVIWHDSCDFPGATFEDCDEDHGQCVNLSATAAECRCVDHFDIDDACETCEGNWDLASDCTACVEGFGGEACAVCELGWSGPSCDECGGFGYALGEDGCEYIQTCNADSIWLVDGALPPADRNAEEFEIGGTSSQPTAVDALTGLEWRLCLAGMTWSGAICDGAPTNSTAADAAALCGDDYAGETDWRLPDVTELATLLDHGASPPTLDDVFIDFGQPAVWTADDCPTEGTDNWAVLFYSAEVVGVSFDSKVLCVRGGLPESPGDVPVRFAVAAADGSTVRDNWSGLEWRRCLAGQVWDGTDCLGTPAAYDWDAAQLACAGTYAGHDDWSLPDATALRSAANYCSQDPASFAVAFPGVAAEPLWSSSELPDTENAHQVDFQYGVQSAAAVETELPVLCARQAD